LNFSGRWPSPVDITISVTEGVPIHRQIVNQVKYLVVAAADPDASAAAEG